MQPTTERAPNNVILHCCTNDIKTPADPEQIAENIINFTKSIKTDKNNIIISSLTPRNDQLNKKAKEVNEVFTRECNTRNTDVIKLENVNSRKYCNISGLHLNWKGTDTLIENIYFV